MRKAWVALPSAAIIIAGLFNSVAALAVTPSGSGAVPPPPNSATVASPIIVYPKPGSEPTGAAPALAANPIHYSGGYVQHRPHVYVVFWGKEWNRLSAEKEHILAFYRWVSGTSYAGILTQYFDRQGSISGQSDLAASFTDERLINGKEYPTGVGFAAVQSEAKWAIESKAWPRNAYENAYVVITPPNTTYSGEAASACGFHSWEGVPWQSVISGVFDVNGCGGAQRWQGTQATAAHEWAEIATDPIPTEPFIAWANPGNGEIADLCEGSNEVVQSAPEIYTSRLFDDYLNAATGQTCVAQDATPIRFSVQGASGTVSGPHEASFGGSVTAAGYSSTYDFWVTGPNGYSARVPAAFQEAGISFAAVPVGGTTSGLQGLSQYTVRLEAGSQLTQSPFTSETSLLISEAQFTTPAWRPLISNLRAQETGPMTATFFASIDGQGTATHYHFEYGTSPGSFSGTIPVPDENIGNGREVSQVASGVEGTIYYRVAATNAEGTTYSPEQTVYVQERPAVTTESAGEIVGQRAVLHGAVNPKGAATKYYFEYGSTPSLGLKTSEVSLGSDSSSHQVSAEIGGLSAGTVYWFRLVAANSAGTRNGAELPFTAGWTPLSPKLPADAVPGEFVLRGVSCSTGLSCMTVGSYMASGNQQVTISEEWNGSEWEVWPMPVPAGATQFNVNAILCSAPSNCAAVGYTNNTNGPFTYLPVVEQWSGTNWTSQAITKPNGFTGVTLRKVACPTASFCEAVGNGVTSSSVAPVAYLGNGSEWEAQTPPLPTGLNEVFLAGVSCTSATFCIAVGSAQNNGTHVPGRPIAERWNGTNWTSELPPIPAGAEPESALNAVSCASATSCEAVGQYRTSGGGGGTRSYAARWNGTSWTNETSVPGWLLRGVSCPVAGSCQAVGENADEEIRVRLKSGSWQQEYTPGPPVAYEATGLNDISCTSTIACMAVGKQNTTGRAIAESFYSIAPATVTTKTAAPVGETTATLHGLVTPNGSETKIHFDYGVTTSYGGSTPEVSAGSGYSAIEEDQALNGLQPGTVYHYRMVATNGAGTTRGKDQTFETNGYPALLNAMPTTDPFNGTITPISNFAAGWTTLPWATGANPKGEDRVTGWGPSNVWPAVNGAAYGPIVNDSGFGEAASATLTENPGIEQRSFSIWLDLPTSPTSQSGYQLRFYDTALNRYTVTLNKWIGGSPTVLAEAVNVSLVNGNTFAVIDKGSTVAAWINNGGGFTQLLSASDSNFSSGTAAVEGSGNNTRLTNFKFGSLQLRAANMNAALNELQLDDTFSGSESPLSEGGAWGALSWDNGTSGHNTGRLEGGWGPFDAFSTLNGAYWTKVAFADTGTGDAVAATLVKRPELAEGRHFELWLNMPGPATVRSGYEERFAETSTNVFAVTISKWQGGLQTILASQSGYSLPVGSKFALVDRAGTVSCWIANGGEYTQFLAANDSTFPAGYSGVAGSGNYTRLTNFRAGPLAPFG